MPSPSQRPQTARTTELPWLDRPDAAEQVDRRRSGGELSDDQAAQLHKWIRDGYIILPGLLPHDHADAINADVAAIQRDFAHLPIEQYKQKFQNMFPGSPATQRAMCLPAVLEWLDLILDQRALPYQTLNLPESSQQEAHSDAILMTTDPPGFLVAAWFALEDVSPEGGPLALYPGSHRLPYVSAHEVGIDPDVEPAEYGRLFDERYYALIKEIAAREDLQPFTFMGTKGDVLIWHSNLLHGALHCTRPGATRRSLIVHYFGEHAEHYSDLWQRPCDLPGLR